MKRMSGNRIPKKYTGEENQGQGRKEEVDGGVTGVIGKTSMNKMKRTKNSDGAICFLEVYLLCFRKFLNIK